MQTAGIAAPSREGARSMPDLGRIKHAVERIATASYNVETFRNRFYGPQPESDTKAAEPDSSYRNDLNDLFEQIGRLEVAVNALSDIG